MKLLAAALSLSLALALGSCSFGDGEGELTGLVWAPVCNWDAKAYELNPTFFGADRIETVDSVMIKIQHGEGFINEVDSWSIAIANASDIATMLNVPIDLATSQDVHTNVFFAHSCKGTKDPLADYEAISGTITFSAFSVPWVDGTGAYYEAVLSNAVFVDSANPSERRAELNGNFRFKFRRGTPAQQFP